MSDATPDILVVGAGPTGLTTALLAARIGLSVRIIEQRSQRARYSKALVTHARTMEALEPLGLADELLQHSISLHVLRLHGAFGLLGSVELRNLDWGNTRYPWWLIKPQYELEDLLESALSDVGVHVEWATRFTSLIQSSGHVPARVTFRRC